MVLLTSVEDGRRGYLKESVGSFITYLPNMWTKSCHTGQLERAPSFYSIK